MKTDVKRIVESAGSPNENDLWLNGTTLKKFQNGEWTVISDGESGGSSMQVQSDWNQTDDTKADYIKNKPEIPSGGSSTPIAIVKGQLLGESETFIPDDGEMTQSEAVSFLLGGGVLFISCGDGSTYVDTYRSEYYPGNNGSIVFNNNSIFWYSEIE